MRIGNHRAPFIDYRKPGMFFITMNKAKSVPCFSSLIEKGTAENPRIFVKPTEIGKMIQAEMDNFKSLNTYLHRSSYIIMPDHIHFLIFIKETMEKTLGKYLASWKRNLFEKIWNKGLVDAKTERIFESGFNDQFIHRGRSLKVIDRYIYNNPYKLWIRKKHPENFERVNSLSIAGEDCSLYGNMSLLDNPFLYAVVVHRRELRDPELIKRKFELWEYAIKNGGVVVGGFISEFERKIRDLGYSFGGKMIYLKQEGFIEERENPQGNEYEHCIKGKMLLVTPSVFSKANMSFREKCVFNNRLAERIAGLKPGAPAGAGPGRAPERKERGRAAQG